MPTRVASDGKMRATHAKMFCDKLPTTGTKYQCVQIYLIQPKDKPAVVLW